MSSSTDKIKVVCVGKNRAIIELVKLALTREGYQVTGVNSGRAGLSTIEQTNPDLVLLDLMMPDMDGWDVFQSMKASDAMQHVPVIIITSEARNIDKVLGQHVSKADGYTIISFSPRDLIRRVKRVIGPIGTLLQGRYKVVGVLHVGRLGSVYRACDMYLPTVRRLVTVKEIFFPASDFGMREMMMRAFARVSENLARLTHAAIPKIYDWFIEERRAYVVMEYINGKDLDAIIKSVPDFLPVDQVYRWALELCDVLSYLHGHEPPIVFHDVKPAHIMIDQVGSVRLIDFGIARVLQPVDDSTEISEGYSPPELSRGEATPARDIYALGATLHHILTRRDPQDESRFTRLPIRALNPKVPPEFETIVNQALSYRPSQRFSTAAAMKEALEKMGGGLNPTGAATNSSETVPEGEAGSGLGMGKMTALWKFECDDEIRSTPVIHEKTVFVCACDNYLYALAAGDGAFKWKFATDGGIVSTPGIATDENLVLVGSEDHNLYAIDIRTGKISWSFHTGGPIRCSIAVTHGIAFFGSDDGRLYAVRLLNGRQVGKYEAGVPIRSGPAITAERVVFGTESGDVIGLDLSGALKWRYRSKNGIFLVIQDNIAYLCSLDGYVLAVNVYTGGRVRQYRPGTPIASAPLVIGNQFFIGSTDNNLCALDAANGVELWKFETQGQIMSTPAYANGAVYIGSTDRNVYSIDVKNGTLRRSFETEGPIVSPGSIADGILYIGSTDNYLYALSL